MSKMKIKVLFAQRTERYEGQFAPEVMASVTEFAYDDYPDWFDGEVKRVREQILNGDLRSFAVVDIKVDQDEISRRLGQMSALEGEIQKEA